MRSGNGMPDNGPMLNAYPDSIGENLSGTVSLLENPEVKRRSSPFTYCRAFSIRIWTEDFQ